MIEEPHLGLGVRCRMLVAAECRNSFDSVPNEAARVLGLGHLALTCYVFWPRQEHILLGFQLPIVVLNLARLCSNCESLTEFDVEFAISV